MVQKREIDAAPVLVMMFTELQSLEDRSPPHAKSMAFCTLLPSPNTITLKDG